VAITDLTPSIYLSIAARTEFLRHNVEDSRVLGQDTVWVKSQWYFVGSSFPTLSKYRQFENTLLLGSLFKMDRTSHD
jgi:hypothetical protein